MKNQQINNEEQALDINTKIRMLPRCGWIEKGSRKKSNETVEISRDLAQELADKTVSFYIAVKQLPYNPFCNCKQVNELLQKAIQELPEGDTADEFEQLIFTHCPCCGQEFKEG